MSGSRNLQSLGSSGCLKYGSIRLPAAWPPPKLLSHEQSAILAVLIPIGISGTGRVEIIFMCLSILFGLFVFFSLRIIVGRVTPPNDLLESDEEEKKEKKRMDIYYTTSAICFFQDVTLRPDADARLRQVDSWARSTIRWKIPQCHSQLTGR